MKKSTLIKAMSQISDEHITEFADLSSKPQKTLDHFKTYAVLAAGIVLMLCTMPIVYHNAKNSDIVIEPPFVTTSNNSDILPHEDTSNRLAECTDTTRVSAASTNSDKKEDQSVSNKADESSEQTSKSATSSSINMKNSQPVSEQVSEVEFYEQPIENNISDNLDEPTEDTSAQITESHIAEENPSSDNSEFIVEQDADADYLPEENNVDDFDVETMGVVVYGGRIYYQDLSTDQNKTDTEKSKALLGDDLGSTIYKNSDWWTGKSQNDVLGEEFISSFDGEIYSVKGKRVEEEIAVKISYGNDEIIVFLKS